MYAEWCWCVAQLNNEYKHNISTTIALNQLVVKISNKVFVTHKKVNLTPGLYTSVPRREFHYRRNNSSSFSTHESCGLRLGHGCRYRKFPVFPINNAWAR